MVLLFLRAFQRGGFYYQYRAHANAFHPPLFSQDAPEDGR